MNKQFNLPEYIKAANAVAPAALTGLNESAVAVTGTPEKTVIYQMIRRAVLPSVLAEVRTDKPNAVVFGKFRKIEDKNALEFSKDGVFFNALQTDFDYGAGSEFQYAQSVYVVNSAFRIDSSVAQFDIINRLLEAVQTGKLEYKQMNSAFGISKLATESSARRTVLSITQELIQDINSVYGPEMAGALVRDCLVSSSSEIINKDAIEFIWKTCAKAENFEVKTYDYETARALVQKIHETANRVTDATGNKCTWALVHPDVAAFIEQSGLVDDGFIGELELVSSNFFTTRRSVVVGFRRDVEDGDYEEKPEFMMGSYIFLPFVEQMISVLDTENMSDNLLLDTRYSISCAPYKDEKAFLRGDVAEYHIDANVNAFGFELVDAPPEPDPEPDPVP